MQINFFNLKDVFTFAAEFFSVKMLMNSSKNLHKNMFISILKTRLSFFDSTPFGRILNRFSRDIESIEFQIPVSFKDFLYTAFESITTIVIIAISTPVSVAVLIPIAIVYVFIEVINVV